MQSFLHLPSGAISNALQNNYIAPNATGLTNWSTTSRIDYNVTSRDTLTVLAAIGRQASSVPVGQTTAGRNVGPVPYNYGQAYAPKTAVWTIEETHVFSPNFSTSSSGAMPATTARPSIRLTLLPMPQRTMGMTGLPPGQARIHIPDRHLFRYRRSDQLGRHHRESTLAANYTVLDNLQWNVGKHSFTFGGQIAWLLYNVINATERIHADHSGQRRSPKPRASTRRATARRPMSPQPAPASPTPASSSARSTRQLYPISAAGVRRALPRHLTLCSGQLEGHLEADSRLGLRYDFFPTVTEVHNAQSFFNPNLANPVTGINGALQFTGTAPTPATAPRRSTTTTRTSDRASAWPTRSIRRR